MPDRVKERRQLRRLLVDRKKSVLMLAPRRIGKTWTMRRLEEDAKEGGYSAVLFDAETASDEETFYRQLARKLERLARIDELLIANAKERLKGAASGDHKHGDWKKAAGELPPEKLVEAYLDVIDAKPTPTIVMVDEIAVFALRVHNDDHQRLEQFLYKLRALRFSHPNVRWLLTGSIGLDWVARNATTEGALNDLEPFAIEPYSKAAAKRFIETSVENGVTDQPFRLSAPAFNRLVARLGWLSPYYLEVVAEQIEPTGKTLADGCRLATKGDVDRAFEELLLAMKRNHFSMWREHIIKNFKSPHKNRMLAILNWLSAKPDGEAFDTILASLGAEGLSCTASEARTEIDVLCHDGFLVLDGSDDRVAFKSGLIRQWWRRWVANIVAPELA